MARVYLIYIDIRTGFYPELHHGLASLAAVIRQNGHVLAFHHLLKEESPEVLSAMVLKFNPDIVGFSLTTNQRKYLKKYSKAIHHQSKVLQIVGGIHATIDPMDVFNVDSIQGVCIGEAEQTFPALLKKIDAGESILDMAGFWWRTRQGRIKKNPVPALNPDLSSLPYPDYSIFNVNSINEAASGWMTMMLTRGCPHRCSYCSNHVLRSIYPNKEDYVRVPSVEHAIGIIKNNLSCYSNVKGIAFSDDLLIWHKKWFKEFADRYRCEVSLPFICNARAEYLTEDICSSLKKAGCVLVAIGVESGSEWVRRYILNRRTSNDQIIKACQLLKYFGIQILSFNILGLPGETKHLMQETLSLNKRIKPDMGAVYYFFPYPGTQLRSTCKQYGLLDESNEELSGYLERPAIRPIQWKMKDCERIYHKLRLYFATRRATKNLGFASSFIAICLYGLFSIFPSFFVSLFTKRSRLKYILRKIMYKQLLPQEPKTREKIIYENLKT